MSTIDTIEQARSDIELVQAALAGVHRGLDTVETVAVATDEVRRGLRNVVRSGAVVLIVGIGVTVTICAVRRARRSEHDAPERTSV